MSYEILRLPRHPGQTWEAALNGAEGRHVLSGATGPERSAQWDRIVGHLRTLLVVQRDTGLHAGDAQTDAPFDGRVHDEPGLAMTLHRPSTLGRVAPAVGVLDVLLGGLLSLGASGRAAGRG